ADWTTIRRLVDNWHKIARYFFGDYYPLTPYSLERTVWMAWQFDCPGEGEGMVQAFRRNESIYEVARLHLHGLEPAACYELTDLDKPRSTEMTGRELTEKGLLVSIPQRPGSVVITYKRTN
nr:GH36 C-terminal domain-containing protein [Planctomycetota bacterium]